MEMLEDLVMTALAVVIRMGIPVAALFIIGYQTYRSRGLPQSLPELPSGEGGLGRRKGPKGSGPGHCRPCWELKPCSPEAREGCPAYQRPEVPCWRAMKTPAGRLQDDCPGCELFLAIPGSL